MSPKRTLSEPDAKFILAFVDEVMTLYEVDDGSVFPWQIEEMAFNIRGILRSDDE